MSFLLAIGLLICWSPSASAFVVPELTGPVVDTANIIDASTERELSRALSKIDKKSDVQMAVLTVKSLEGDAIESVAIQVVDKWKLGSESSDKGLLLLISAQDRRLRFEVGQGLEGDLTDLLSKRIIDKTMVPMFKAGKMSQGILLGSYQALQAALPTTDVAKFFRTSVRHASSDGRRKGGIPWHFLIMLILMFFFGGRGSVLPLLLGASMGSHRGGFGGSRGGFGGGGFGGGGGGFSGGGASGGW